MALTPEETRNRLKKALDAGVITQQQYDAAIDKLNSALLSSSRSGQGSDIRQRSSAPARSSGGYVKPRPDYSSSAAAPYRFVSYNPEGVVLAEPEVRAASIETPLRAGLSARIVVEWEAESPLLIGEQVTSKDNTTSVAPLVRKVGGRDDYYLPGATLKGAIRVVAEIAAGARLSQVNRERVFPLRDLNHGLYRPKNDRPPVLTEGQSSYPISQARKVHAGWLKLKDKGIRPTAQRASRDKAPWLDNFVIEPCAAWPASGDPGWCVVVADDLLQSHEIDLRQAHDDKIRDPHVGSDFTQMSMLSKYQTVGAIHGAAGKKGCTINPASKSIRFADAGLHFSARCIRPDRAGAIEGCLVFSGRAPRLKDPRKLKKVEYAFPPPRLDGGVDINKTIMKAFRQINSQAVNDDLTPESNWETALQAFEANPDCAVPVFYVGDLKDQKESGPNAFFFGLTRFFKAPHAWAFRQVLEHSGVADPVNSDGVVDPARLDMVDALFGYVYEPAHDTDDSHRPADYARKGRVAFSAARLIGAPPVVGDEIRTVMMGSKPSFAPFYLAPAPDGMRDYSAPEKPRIAGRKRYPARMPAHDPNNALAAVTAKLKQQYDRVKEAQNGREPDARVVTKLRFLQPGKDRPLKFLSELRLFNVTQAELGLILWALTFGGRQATHRHMIGRAKPFGAGQMKVTLRDVQIEMNATEGVQSLAQEQWSAYLRKLDAYIAGAGRGPAVEKARGELLATADPANGAALAQAGKLDTMELSTFQAIRRMVNRDVDGAPPIHTPLLPLVGR